MNVSELAELEKELLSLAEDVSYLSRWQIEDRLNKLARSVAVEVEKARLAAAA